MIYVLYILFIFELIYCYKRERDKQKYIRDHTVIIKERSD